MAAPSLRIFLHLGALVRHIRKAATPMKQNFNPLVTTPTSMPLLRWHVPPVVRTYEQIARVLIQRGEKHVSLTQVQQVCEEVSRKLRLQRK